MRQHLKLLFWISLLASVAVYAAMVLYSLPTIQQEAGNLRPFDLRPGGYSLADAGEFLSKISDEGRALYLTVQHRLDLFYPALLAIALGSGLWLMAPESWLGWRWLLAVLPLPGMVFDFVENSLVANLLTANPASLDEELVAAASVATIAKSVFTTIAMVVLLVLLVMWALRKRRSEA